MKKRIGIFGGTFDPIHKGHVALAERFLEHMLLDEVWFLVTPQNPWKKDTNLTDDAFRLSMVKESLKNHTRLIASDYEFNLPKPSYTYQTLRRLRAEYPDTEFIILIGADNWVKFDQWAEAAEILKNHRLAVYPRKEYDVDEAAMPEGVTFFKTEFYDVSSTQIRDMISRGENITALVPEGVAPMLYEKYGKKTMKTAVVILNWNGAKMMRRFLPYVVQHTMKEAEVWVVDNASTDDSLELLRTSFPTVKTLAFQKNWGYAYGYNKAIDTIDADYFVLLNSDVECSPGWLEPLVRCLDDNPDVVAVQPKLLQAYMDTPAENITESTFEYAGAAGGFVDKFGYPYCRGRLFDVVEKDHGQYDSAIDIHWATGACLVVRAEEYKKAGGLDGRFFAHCEEIDLCWRLRIAGWRIMCVPESRVYHLGGGTLPQGNPRKTYLNFRNNLTMIYKNIPEQRLKSVMRIRRLLDYVAMLQSLVKGNRADATAIWNARRDFRNWKHSFRQDRTDIQTNRRLSADRDLAPLSLLWQFFAIGRKTWDKLPSVIIVLLMLFNAFIMQADDKTRGIGVYPGRVSDDFSVFTEPSDEYRNIAKNHAAYASSSFDHNLKAEVCAYDINGGLLKRTVEKVDALNDATLDLNAVNTDGVALLRMRLIEKKNVLSENTYLLDASALGTVEPVTLNPKVLVGNGNMTVTIDAPADAPAYMVRLNMLDGSGEQILPVIYEDNYFHLLPGERRTLNISWLAEDQHAEGVQLEVAGFNARKIIIK